MPAAHLSMIIAHGVRTGHPARRMIYMHHTMSYIHVYSLQAWKLTDVVSWRVPLLLIDTAS